jgi:hypothetical protein
MNPLIAHNGIVVGRIIQLSNTTYKINDWKRLFQSLGLTREQAKRLSDAFNKELMRREGRIYGRNQSKRDSR